MEIREFGEAAAIINKAVEHETVFGQPLRVEYRETQLFRKEKFRKIFVRDKTGRVTEMIDRPKGSDLRWRRLNSEPATGTR